MTDRATARHRAPSRATTPLSGLSTTLTTAVSDHVGAIGRGGAVVAMSSGLVASMAIPSGAVTNGALDSGPKTASLPALPAAPLEASSLLAVHAELLTGAPVSAPAAATVQFEKAAFTAVPKKVVRKAPRPVVESRTDAREEDRAGSRAAARASRSAERKALPEKKDESPGNSFGSARGSSVLAIAARYYGIPYRYGGTTPRGFDCSGFTKYVFGQVGVSLPRTAEQQRQAARQIPRSQARAGDLVFTLTGGRASHVGIYAGDGMMVDSPRTGKSVSKRKIWSSNIVFGRI